MEIETHKTPRILHEDSLPLGRQSFDPALNLVYVGTSVTSPSPKFMLGGVDRQHQYHNSTLAHVVGNKVEAAYAR